MDSLRFDGETLHPLAKTQIGRPKKRRFRQRSKFVDSSKSTITCSICGESGHNKRSCQERKKNLKQVEEQKIEESKKDDNN